MTKKHNMKKPQPLSREFLLKRGFCCNNGCTNCPYNKNNNIMELTKEEIEALKAYFDAITINTPILVRKIGEDKLKEFEAVINKIYKDA
jgi:hypothetical protein